MFKVYLRKPRRKGRAVNESEVVLRFWQLPSEEPTRMYMPEDGYPEVVRGNGGDQPCWTFEEIEALLTEEAELRIEDGSDPSEVYALEVTVRRVSSIRAERTPEPSEDAVERAALDFIYEQPMTLTRDTLIERMKRWMEAEK